MIGRLLYAATDNDTQTTLNILISAYHTIYQFTVTMIYAQIIKAVMSLKWAMR